MLNILWPIFIIISIIYAIFSGNLENLNKSIFESTESAVNLTLTLLGMTCLWSGIMEVASKTDIIKYLSKVLQTIVKKIFYNIKIQDKDVREKYHIIDDNCESDAYWIDVNEFKNNKKIIYPEQIFKYI